MRRIINSILLLLLFAVNISGQTPRFDRFDISTGLSQNNINGLVIDDIGNVWTGTLDGLNRYNGYEFEVFKPLAGEPGHISGNHIIAMGKGLNGDVWITTRDGVLNQFDAVSQQFVQYGDHLFREVDIYPFRDLVQSSDSLLWFSDGEFVGLLNTEQKICQKFEAPDFVHGIAVKGDSVVIYGGFGINYLKPEYNGKETIIKSFPLNDFSCYHLKQENGRWYATTQEDISVLNEQLSGKMAIVTYEELGLAGFQPSSVNSFAVQQESFWFGDNNLLMRIREDQGIFKAERFTYDAENDYSFKGYHVTNLSVDDLGNLWIGTLKNGLNHFNYVKNQFSHYHLNSQSLSSPDTDPVRAICKTSDGNLWLGFDREGLGILSENGDQQYVSHYYTKSGEERDISNVRTIFEDSENNIWIGMANHLCIYNRKSERIETVNARFSWNWPYRCYSVKELNKGLVTITASLSIGIVDLNTGELETIPLIENNTNISGTVRDIVADKYGNLWVAKDDNGLLRVEYPESQLINIRKETHQLSDNKAYCLLAMGDSLWIGTNSGLNLWSLSGNRIVRKYYERDGLSNNIIYSLTRDSRGHLWMSTNRGISSFNFETEQFRTFLANDFFMDDAHFEAGDGRIYYGGYTGVVAFHPDEIEQPDFEINAALERFRLFNREVLPGDTIGNRILFKKPFDQTESIRLKHYENSFTIHFNAYPFDYPNHNNFRYRLLGLQDDWIYSEGTNRQAAYTVVPPGNYTFQLQAAPFQEGFEGMTELNIHVVPPFWQTLGFKISLLFVILSGIFGGYQMRLRQIRKRNIVLKSRVEEQTRALRDRNMQIVEMSEQLHEADQSKLRFFTNISHDFKTPLTLILAHLENLDVKKSKAVRTIKNNALQLLNLISQLIDLRKLDQGQLQLSVSKFDVVGFSAEVVDSFRVLARQKGIDLKFFCTSEKLDVWLDRDKIEKIIYNLLANAIKYTPKGSKVLLTIVEGSDRFYLDVEDEGIGMSEEETEHIFDRFYRSGNGQKYASGHGIGLTIVKGLTDVQKGTIDIYSRIDEGTKFHLTFLKGRQYFDAGDFKESGHQDPLPLETSVLEESMPQFSRFGEKKILVVEDNVELVDFLNEMLQPHFTVLTAENGAAAFQVLKDFVPDLIISDIMMPVMDGIEFCRRVKADIRTSHVPFILLTAKTDTEMHVEGFELGVDDFVEKPFNSRILMARLKALLENRENLKRHFYEVTDSPAITPGLTKRDQEFIARINIIIDQRYGDPFFNVEKLSEEMFMSRSTFYRKFKDLTGVAAADYIRKIRLNKAAALLRYDDLSVSQVAENVGFQSMAHFRKCFKMAFGETPSAWGK
jgi:signal transduction histidine kinase/DNA-binding response OmpR family regulator/ligand-binding sensor domain-containing protein